MPHLTQHQMISITRELDAEELFPGICDDPRLDLDED
jgi:hypothetical protein